MGIEGGPSPGNSDSSSGEENSDSEPKLSRREWLKKTGMFAAGAAAGATLSNVDRIIGEGESEEESSRETVSLDEIQDYAAYKLSQMELPDYSRNEEDIEASPRLVKRSIEFAAFHGDEKFDRWLKLFSGRIDELSEGKVTFRKATKREAEEEFRINVRGADRRMILTDGEVKRSVHFGPYGNPFSFDDEMGIDR